MDPEIRRALERDRLVDITTIGRKTGQSWRKEVAIFFVDGHLYLLGTPRPPRSWYANLLAKPEFTYHLKQSIQRDLPARAEPIRDNDAKRAVILKFERGLSRRNPIDLEDWVEHSPIVEVELLVQEG